MAGENGWRNLTIADICDEIYDGPHATPKKIDRGPVFLSISSLTNGRIDLSESAHLSETDFKKWTRRVTPQKEDLVFSYETRLGEAALIPDGLRCCLGRRMALIRPYRELLDPQFFLYYFLSPALQNEIRRYTICGSTVERLALADIRKFRIKVPPLSEQKAIAEILCALDAKIELNRRMNATLEGMARAIFKSWFVDFDPVRAKMDGRQPVGLSPATAALFPESFVHQNGELIPKGWSIRKVGDVTHRVTKGDTPRKEAIQAAPEDDPLIPMLRVNAITETGEILRDKMQYIPESIHLGKSKRSILQENDILYTNAGTIGRVSLVQPRLLPANTNQAIAIVRPDTTKVPPAFLFMLLRQPEFQAELHCDIVQAVQANLALGKIADAEAIFPPEDKLPELIAPIESMQKRIWANRRESETLAALRDTLLPRLLSGDLRVADPDSCHNPT